MSVLVESMKANTININFNINSNDISNNTNLNYNAVTTVNNQGSNNEEIEKSNFRYEWQKKLEVQQSQTIEDHENLQQIVYTKMNKTNFKMKEFEKEVLRISELKAKINFNLSKIEDLESSHIIR